MDGTSNRRTGRAGESDHSSERSLFRPEASGDHENSSDVGDLSAQHNLHASRSNATLTTVRHSRPERKATVENEGKSSSAGALNVQQLSIAPQNRSLLGHALPNRVTAQDAHLGEITLLEKFDIPFPNQGRPTDGTEKKKDDRDQALKKRNKFLQIGDMVLARVEYSLEENSGQTTQPVSVFQVKKIFKDRHGCATWMRVRWYGEEQDVFLGKYFEKKEKLDNRDKKLMESLRLQGQDVDNDIRFKITPDENLFLATSDENNLVQGQRLEAPMLVHWGKLSDLLTNAHTIRHNLIRLITTDIRLRALPGVDIVEAVKLAQAKNLGRKARKKRVASSPSSSEAEETSESTSSSSMQGHPNKRAKTTR